MNEIRDQIHAMLKKILPDYNSVVEEELVTSGRLSSLNVIELASWLERDFHLDFLKIGFNVYDFETVDSIVNLINSNR